MACYKNNNLIIIYCYMSWEEEGGQCPKQVFACQPIFTKPNFYHNRKKPITRIDKSEIRICDLSNSLHISRHSAYGNDFICIK